MADVVTHGARLGRLLRQADGEVLAREVYNAEVLPRVRASAAPCWKLERRQHFEEPDVPSWVAARDGDWPRALALIAGMRPGLAAASGSLSRLHRVRVVECPPSPYLQWETHVFLARADAGETIRVVDVEDLAGAEADGALPELLTVEGEVMYEILYDAAGGHTGGRRIEDPGVIAACAAELRGLFGTGRCFRDYFDREIAPLPAPPSL